MESGLVKNPVKVQPLEPEHPICQLRLRGVAITTRKVRSLFPNYDIQDVEDDSYQFTIDKSLLSSLKEEAKEKGYDLKIV